MFQWFQAVLCVVASAAISALVMHVGYGSGSEFSKRSVDACVRRNAIDLTGNPRQDCENAYRLLCALVNLIALLLSLYAVVAVNAASAAMEYYASCRERKAAAVYFIV